MRSRLLQNSLPCCALAWLSLSLNLSAQQSLSSDVRDKLTQATVYIETQLALAPRDWADFKAAGGNAAKTRPSMAASGSGFIVSEDGYVITNAHVVDGMTIWMKVEGNKISTSHPARPGEDAPINPKKPTDPFTWRFVPASLTVVVRSGEANERSFQPRIMKVERSSDLALLKIPAEEDLPAFELNLEDDVESGAPVFMAGFPGGKLPDVAPFMGSANSGSLGARHPRLSINVGTITAIREFKGQRCYQLDIRANHGNSGGPITDAEGRVLGVLFAGIDSMQSINYAIPVRYLKAVLPSDSNSGETTSNPTGGQSFGEFLESGSFSIGKRP